MSNSTNTKTSHINKCIFDGIQLSDGLTFSADKSEHLNITIILLRLCSQTLHFLLVMHQIKFKWLRRAVTTNLYSVSKCLLIQSNIENSHYFKLTFIGTVTSTKTTTTTGVSVASPKKLNAKFSSTENKMLKSMFYFFHLFFLRSVSHRTLMHVWIKETRFKPLWG